LGGLDANRARQKAKPRIVFSEHTDQEGATVFRHACKLALEGIVSKRLSAPYRSGPSRDWLKVKNPDSPAMRRARGAVVTARRFPPPWRVVEHPESFWVQDASGQTVGWFYFRDHPETAREAQGHAVTLPLEGGGSVWRKSRAA
jgi:hypothetical protein